MWRSSKNPPKAKKSILPPSERQLFWNKSDRVVPRSQFRVLQKAWTSVTRRPAEPEAVAASAAANASKPAWMSYRTKGPKAPPIYFRTKSADTKKKP